MNNSKKFEYIYSLDALRGIAAFIVVFYHWRHFFYVGNSLQQYEKQAQPLYDYLVIFYDSGWRCVQLFFCISGFIFHWLYSLKISQNEITFGKFIILRFSRLWPLHILTLFIVLTGQTLLRINNQSSFVYSNNDIYHLFLNFFLASNWGLQKGYSFNGPIWSVSVEVILYLAFFITCKIKIIEWWKTLFIIVTILIIITYITINTFLIALLCFYTGSLTFQIYNKLKNQKNIVTISVLITCITVLLLLATIVNSADPFYLYGLYCNVFAFNIMGKDIFGYLILKLSNFPFFFELLLFPLSILSLCCLEKSRLLKCEKLNILGNLSYSVYLIHFPLQLVFYNIICYLNVSNQLFYNFMFMVSFFVLLTILSYISFKHIEMPLQKIIRSKLIKENE